MCMPPYSVRRFACNKALTARLSRTHAQAYVTPMTRIIGLIIYKTCCKLARQQAPLLSLVIWFDSPTAAQPRTSHRQQEEGRQEEGGITTTDESFRPVSLCLPANFGRQLHNIAPTLSAGGEWKRGSTHQHDTTRKRPRTTWRILASFQRIVNDL